MCGFGESNDQNVNIYLGFYGANLEVGDLLYQVQGENTQPTTKEEMTKHIMDNYTYEEFIQKILECIDNGSEE